MMFSDSERQIFQYRNWDGVDVFCDPAEALRKMKEAAQGQLKNMIADSRSEDPVVSSPAVAAIKRVTMDAFGLQPFSGADGSGWLEVAIIGLFDGFNAYLKSLKKNTAA